MKSGYVAIVGKPNVGKSTLLNRLVGEKLSGVSPKPQTTRTCIRGIVTTEQGQIVYLDTPGLHNPRDGMGRWMIEEVKRNLPDADVIYWMILPRQPDPEDQKVAEALKALGKPVILLINQVDRNPKPSVLLAIDAFRNLLEFTDFIPISAATGLQVDLLTEKTYELLPERPLYFPEDQISDQNERFTVREIIAEKLFHFTGEEIPYSSAVMMEDFKEKDNNLVSIQATIYVEKDSQKKIVIGENGQKIKQIGQSARKDIERFLDKRVFLELWVKTVPNWKRDREILAKLGYAIPDEPH